MEAVLNDGQYNYPLCGDRQRALVAEACISGQQQYMESLMGTAGPSVLTEEQQASIRAAQYSNTVRATVMAQGRQGKTDRRWEVWGPVA